MRTAGLLLLAMLGRAHAEPPRVEGRITIARGKGGDLESSASAVFARSPLIGPVTATDGPCTIHRRSPRGIGLSAGPISIVGTSRQITLEPSALNGGVNYHRAVPSPSFEEGDTITVDVSGSSDVPAFTASVTAPPLLVGYSPPASLSRSGYVANWTPVTGSEILIVIGAVDRRMTDGLAVMCRVPDRGTFTVPASTFSLIPASLDRAVVSVTRIAETVQTAGDAHIAVQAVSSILSGPYELGPDASVPPLPNPSCAPCETTPRRFFSLSFGMGGVSRNGDVPPMTGDTFRVQFGQRIHHRLHLVEELNTIGSTYGSPSPTSTSEDHGSFGAGVRWTPFEPRKERNPAPFPILFEGPYIDATAFFVTAVVGANVRERWIAGASETAWSPMASFSLSYLLMQGHDWAFGSEFREQLARYDGHIQRGWQLLIVADLHVW